GASRERSEWQLPRPRTPESSERAYLILNRLVEHAKKTPGVRFITARDLLQIYESPLPPRVDRGKIAEHLVVRQTFLQHEHGSLSAADMLLALLGLEPQAVEGPTARAETTYSAASIARPAFQRVKTDVSAFVRAHHRLPAEVWIGSEKLSLPDFAATLAGEGPSGDSVMVRKGNPEMEKYIASDPVKTFRWLIHPEGFSAPKLLGLARLQAW